jgi:hypothetical protein
MSGLPSVGIGEARGSSATRGDVDSLTVVIGCSSAPTGLSTWYLSGDAVFSGVGYGDAPDLAAHVIEQNGGAKKLTALWTCAGTTEGSYGTIDVSGVHGTSVITVNASSKPYGTYEAVVRFPVGGTIGTDGIRYQESLDNGRSWSQLKSLETATRIVIPNSGITFDLSTGSPAKTIVAGDFVKLQTAAPAPSEADIDAAFTALARSSYDFGIVACEFPMTASLLQHCTSGLNTLRSMGKLPVLIGRTRTPSVATNENDAAWNASVAGAFSASFDDRIVLVAGYLLTTYAVSSRQYLRSPLAEMVASVARVSIKSIPLMPYDQPMTACTLVDATGATIGHDEGTRGLSTGLSNETLGNRFWCTFRWPDVARREEVYATVPWTLFTVDSRIKDLPTRRVANAIERAAISAGISDTGADVYYYPANPTDPTSYNRLAPASRAAIQAKVFARLSSEFRGTIQNADDASLETGLVQISDRVVKSGSGLLTVSGVITPVVFGHLLSLDFTLAIQ